MNRIKLIGLTLISIVVIILASVGNAVGYQTIQSTNLNKINHDVDQRELLFQTIVDIANNKEIQEILLNSQINIGGLSYQSDKFSSVQTLFVTTDQIKLLNFFGSLAGRIFSNSKMQSMFEQYQFNNQEMQREITAVIKNDAALSKQVTQLSNSGCDCENEKTSSWSFPILCPMLYTIGSICSGLAYFHIFYFITITTTFICVYLGNVLDCYWVNE